MKKIILLVTVLLAIASAKAQEIGGFGYVSVGASYITSTKIQRRLQENSLLGSDFAFNKPGTHIGVRILGVYKKFLVGGAGYSKVFTGNSEVGEVNLKVAGRFFNAGYILLSKPKTHVYGFLGIGWGNSLLRISKTNEDVMRTVSFGPNQDVSYLSQEVSQSGVGYEFGIGLHHFVIRSNDSYEEANKGLLLGLVVGANFFPSTKWVFKANETNVDNMGNISSFYIGLTIGGGSITK